ncbi:hypothetical protein MNBD_CHLOROFLEXI01-43 [hydrothermal vent metagenome]|uniref:histidine kinase n=1 Tax=hydrothermal vent metagenome TaxID=652676 RepID=A0A3B0VNP0_9ZZZZ
MSQTTQQLQQAVHQAKTPQQAVTTLLDLAIHFRTFDVQQGISAVQKAQKFANNGNVSPKEQVRCLLILGRLHCDLRDYEAAIQQLEEASAAAEKYKEYGLKARILGSIGFTYLGFGNFTRAMSSYLKALEIARQENETVAEIDALSGIGLIYSDSGNSKEALIHLNQALTLVQEINGNDEHIALNNCALEYAKIGEFEQALEFGQRSLKLAQEKGDQLSTILARNRIGEAHMGMGQFKRADGYFQQNLDYLQTPSLKPRRLHTLLNLGKLRIQQQKQQEAVTYLEKSLEIAVAIGGKQYIYEIHENLAGAYKALGNHEAALAHYEQFHKFKEIVFDEKSKAARRGLEVAYHTEAAKQESVFFQQKSKQLEKEVSERKRAEKSALSASKAKSQFLATMSHELRTPLNSIIGFAELVELELNNQQNYAIMEDARRIRKNGLHLLELVNDMLDMAQIETGKLLIYPEEVSPWLIVQEVVDFIPRFAKNGVEFIVSADPDLPNLIVDTMRIKQILLNLLSNAFKFTEKGWVKLSAIATAVSIEFIIEDSGIGIPSDQIPILFETFTQVDIPQNRTLRGTGLGLPISRDLAKLHSGTITVVSKLGKGSKFTVSLPRKADLPHSTPTETITIHE